MPASSPYPELAGATATRGRGALLGRLRPGSPPAPPVGPRRRAHPSQPTPGSAPCQPPSPELEAAGFSLYLEIEVLMDPFLIFSQSQFDLCCYPIVCFLSSGLMYMNIQIFSSHRDVGL
ncbi:hypothetical protein BS78_K035400 [Paspalum vaginatum]|uniref:Uncharacterized protein n=1 Tax=Paspalum vaginatum TaxID=158149 RepID=A0A9W8CG54_9POAL|nr:hypothetical protein BS78_K035400 [Paspalum vaginatum]